MKINDLVNEAHETAIEKGWWKEPRNDYELIALMHSELSEAVEELRKGMPAFYSECPPEWAAFEANGKTFSLCWYDETIGSKPEGIAIELADCIIRIADYFGKQGWNLENALRIKMEYNKTRSHRHGGKKA